MQKDTENPRENQASAAHSDDYATEDFGAENFDAEGFHAPLNEGDNDVDLRAATVQESEHSEFKGIGYGGDRDPQDVLQEYRAAARQNPESSSHQAALAEGYAAADQPHKALRQYQRALALGREQGEEEMPDAHLGIGDLCRTFALSAAAVKSYERAVRLRPQRPYYRWKLAVALAAIGLYDQSVTQLSKALELAPRDTYYHFQLADVYLLAGRSDDAIREFQYVVELAPRDDYYHLRLGAALLKHGREPEAISHFERAVELKPENPSYRTLLRYAYTRNGQEPAISVDIEMLELGAYDEDFVRRFQKLSGDV